VIRENASDKDEPVVDSVSCLVYSSSLKKQLIYSSETSVDFHGVISSDSDSLFSLCYVLIIKVTAWVAQSA
jgi:hypothetical protein